MEFVPLSIELILSILVSLIVFLYILIQLCITIKNYKQYKKTSYYLTTNNSYYSILKNKGKYGEYLLYLKLCYLEKLGAKFLFNLYLPKGYDKTTEIDLIMLCSKGIFVFENKNYNGWIFGNENQKYWMQIIYSYKSKFFNPILQNKLHIRCLKRILKKDFPIHNIVIFSDNCKLKNITVKNPNINVMNLYDISNFITRHYDNTVNELLSQKEINNIYDKLYIYGQANSKLKDTHIKHLKNNE